MDCKGIKAGNGDQVLIKPVGRYPGSPLKRLAPGFFETEFLIFGFVKSFLKSGLGSLGRRVIKSVTKAGLTALAESCIGSSRISLGI